MATSLVILVSAVALAQDSPHGPGVKRCVDCHSGESWHQLNGVLNFDHENTSFPLRGQHRYAACRQCHVDLHFKGTTTDCFGCHKRDYESAVALNHTTAGFPTQCTECHAEDASSWLASFDHDRTHFPTRGMHATLPCSTCHARNQFRGIASECVSCHRREYLATTSPNHATAHFGTDCATCHRALTWQPASLFPHDQYFPISSASTHRPGRWNTCADCHANQANYATFECINCHTHNKSSTDSIHRNRSGYQFVSSACYRCHPQG
jgi:hypothetical protein